MKSLFTAIAYLLLILSASLISCKKEDLQKPTPAPGKSNQVQFILNEIPGEPTGGTVDLHAVVSIVKSHNSEVVVSNKKLSFTFNGKYVSEKITLADGAYKVTKFLLQNSANVTRYATPVAGSEKATQVQKPLAIDVAIPKPALQELPVEVVKVESGDLPQYFGYPAGTFNQPPGDGNTSLKIKVKAVFGVGDIVYDSIPASLTIHTWDAAGQMTSREMELQAGANEVLLSKEATKYQLILTKWGKTNQMTLQRNQVDEGTVYSLGGNSAHKRLTLKEDFLLVEGAYRPDAKTQYFYNSNGSISKIDFYQKKPQHSELKRYFTDVYVYQAATGDFVRKINRLDDKNVFVGFTEFTYNSERKVVNMHRKIYDQETYASVEYAYPAGHALITIDYLYDNGNAMEYKMRIRGGNKVEESALSSTGGTEGGTFSYDFNINPYAHMKMPDLYLSNLSRNNLVGQQKGYGGNIPSGVPYKWEYKYDNEGYPIELVKSFKSYLTGEHLYTVKSVFTY
ncbi:MAG TPA: hypothetical protein VGN63_00250 [Flavisolibacter sp.]|jgi:hypothetical protein|nr:hypothetical protein [Flavisolibacter sp.]